MGSAHNPIIIAGAGMTGMMTALLLRQHYPQHPIVIVESAAEPGGNYRCIDYGPHGQFDQGMRMLYETGIPEFDALIHRLLPESEWLVFSGNTKDIAGIFWNGALQAYSPYIDLRRLPVQEFEQCKTELLQVIDADLPVDHANAKTYFNSRFGSKVAAYLCTALERLHKLPAEALDTMATQQPAMNRVIAFDCNVMKNVLDRESWRSRIAWPNQLTLPMLRPFNQAALYPKHYGMNRVIDNLRMQLERNNVKFVFKDAIQQMSLNDDAIAQLSTRGGRHFENPLHVYWTGNLPGLAALVEATPVNIASSRPPEAILVHMLLPHLSAVMEQLYHFYCFDKRFHTFRITHYASYCPEAKQSEGYPICMELWHLEADNARVAAIALSELQRFGIVDDISEVKIIGIARTPNLHAGCSLETTQAMRKLRNAITDKKLSNLTMLGVFAEENQMLLYEVWKTMYRRIIESIR